MDHQPLELRNYLHPSTEIRSDSLLVNKFAQPMQAPEFGRVNRDVVQKQLFIGSTDGCGTLVAQPRVGILTVALKKKKE